MADFTLKNIAENLANTVADLSSLEVMTFTGNVNDAIDPTGNTVNWNALLTAAKASGTIKLVACTRLEFDGDARTFQTAEKFDRLEDLLKLHNDTVALGLQTRSAILSLVGETVNRVIGKK